MSTTKKAVLGACALCALAGGAAHGWHAWQTEQASRRRAALEQGTPSAVLDHAEHDFGLMDLGEERQHVFRLTNAGDGILTIRRGPSSCKCTVLDLRNGELPPGESRDITLAWEAESENENFRHGAAFFTNDPEHPDLSVVAVGKIRRHFGVSSGDIVFRDVKPGETATAEIVVFSQAFDRFEIERGTSSSPELSWSASPASPELLTEHGARSGFAVQVSLAVGEHKRTLGGRLVFRLQAEAHDGSLKQSTVAVAVAAPVRPPFRVYGAGWDSDGFLDLGAIEQGKGVKRKLFVLTRAERPEAKFFEMTATPSFLEVRVVRDERVRSARGQYVVEIEIPADAPVCNHMGIDMAKIVLKTDHPDQPELRLPVEFAIVP